MSIVGLSSGCFTGFEGALATSGVKIVELSSHRHDRIGKVLNQIDDCRITVASVHCPCPSRGSGINLADPSEEWGRTVSAVMEAMEMARIFKAQYVVVHPYYSVQSPLPSNDIERMEVLRKMFAEGELLTEYLKSDRYNNARRRTVNNLRKLLPILLKCYPDQRIVLENLNPRIGYGGIRLSDVTYIAGKFGGDIGICLDVGHLGLSQSALEESLLHEIDEAKDLIWTSHIHQNFAGVYAADRFWYDDSPRIPKLQELDTHLPLLTKYRKIDSGGLKELLPDNSVFAGKFIGNLQYCGKESSESQKCVSGAVPVSEMLSKIPAQANRILEYDSRFARLEDILWEYRMVEKATHPVQLY